MTTRPFTLKPSFLLLAVLSASLLSACSNNADDTVAVDGADTTSAANPSDNADNTTNPDLAPTTPEPTIADTNNLVEDNNTESEISITSDEINPLTNNNQPSLVTNPTESGTPEDTVKQALNTLYYGEVKDAAKYYKVDMANFEQELANTQGVFQQTVERVTITDTKYNEDKTRATIDGELMLKGQTDPAPLTYELQKVNGQWKILG